MNLNKKNLTAMISTAILLGACGGSSTSAVKTSYKLTGTVPGTLIEAFCNDGSFYSTKSTQNNTSRHPFSLTLPVGLTCRIVMTTNEDDPDNKVITPIKVVNAQGAGGIAFESTEDIDLAHIDLALSRTSMTLDANQDGVEDAPIDVTLDADTLQNTQIVTGGNDPLDTDNDGIINIYEDDDGDHINNRDDDDDDNDGIKDIDDKDHGNDLDGDGIDNSRDVDDDNDGIDDKTDDDDDNDGIKDVDDDDDDNDGIKDSDDDDHREGSDRDSDNDDRGTGSSNSESDDRGTGNSDSDNDDRGTGNSGSDSDDRGTTVSNGSDTDGRGTTGSSNTDSDDRGTTTSSR